MYIIEQESKPVATISLSWQDEKYWGQQDPIAGYVHRLAVRTGCHGSGISSFALDWAGHQVRTRNRHHLRLTCDYRNTGLCAYYELHGFISLGIRPIPELRDYVASLFEKTG
jgi:RimJ/RimL family protein N-acetyltransferase